MSIVNVEKVEQFNELTNEGTVLVDFWAPWCGPCKMLAPVLDKLVDEVQDVKVVKVNVDEFGELAGQHNVMGIPTMVLFKDGKSVDKIVGAQQLPQLKKFIEKNS